MHHVIYPNRNNEGNSYRHSPWRLYNAGFFVIKRVSEEDDKALHSWSKVVLWCSDDQYLFLLNAIIICHNEFGWHGIHWLIVICQRFNDMTYKRTFPSETGWRRKIIAFPVVAPPINRMGMP